MDAIQTVPVSELETNCQEVLQQTAAGPVLLLQSSQVAAVLVSPGEWNAIALRLKRLREMELLLEAKRISAEMDRDRSKIVLHQALKRKLAEKKQAQYVGT